MNQSVNDTNIAIMLADYLRNEDVPRNDMEALILDDQHANVVDAVMKNHWKSTPPVLLDNEEQTEIWERIKNQVALSKPSGISLKLRLKRFSYSVAALFALAVGVYLYLDVAEPVEEAPLVSAVVAPAATPPAKAIAQAVRVKDTPPAPRVSPRQVSPVVVLEESHYPAEAVAKEMPYSVEGGEEAPRTEYTTAEGETINVLLADGSRVKVYEKTQLSCSQEFADSNREVSLSGRAYFEVARHGTSIFRVSTSDVSIEVLGTAFDARTYETESQSVIRVEKGCVRVSTPDDTRFVLTAHQQLVYDRASKTVSLLKETARDSSKKKKKKTSRR